MSTHSICLYGVMEKGSKFFHFRVDLFSEGAWCAGNRTESNKNLSPLSKM